MAKNNNKIQNNKSSISVVILFTFLSIYAFTLLFMYFWGLMTSLKSNAEFRINLYWLPKGLPWEWDYSNYTWAFSQMSIKVIKNDTVTYVGLLGLFKNSVILATLGPIVSLFTTWLIAYLMSSFPEKFLSKLIFRLNIIVMMVPIVGSLPSALQLYKAMGIYDTWIYIIFTGLGSFTGTNLIIFQTYMSTVAKEIREAACIDGANHVELMFLISFPLTLKMFATLYLLACIGSWNNYMTNVIWLPSKPTIAFGIFKITSDSTTVGSWPPPQMAGCMLLAFPMLILFLIFKDKIVGQVTMGALKG